MSFSEGDFERLEIDFVKGPLVDLGTIGEAPILLVVAHEMLERCPGTRALDATDESRTEFSAKKRIFAVILEVPPAEGIPLDIDPGGQKKVGVVEEGFHPHHLPYPEHQFLREGGCQAGGGREANGRQAIGSVFPRNPKAQRTIVHDDGRDIFFLIGGRFPKTIPEKKPGLGLGR